LGTMILKIYYSSSICSSWIDSFTKVYKSHWFSLGTPVSASNKTDLHDIIEMSVNMTLATINQTNQFVEVEFTVKVYKIHCQE